ncbi:MAG: hypothetical protein V4584_04375 [Verrucomicrobiota bacterium]
MKTFLSIPVLAFGFACSGIPVSAQNLDDVSESNTLPVNHKAEGIPREAGPLYDLQNPQTLDSRKAHPVNRDSVVELDVLSQPSHHGETYQKFMSVESEEILTQNLARLSATYREIATPSSSNDCVEVALSVKQQIRLDPATVLETVEREITTNPSCACEVVKTALQTADGEPSLVIGIVETSIAAAPEHMRLISQCAIAAAPESLSIIQALLAKLDPNGGDSSSSAKSPKAAVDAIKAASNPETIPNPLDLPPMYIVAPAPIMAPRVTNVDP